MYTENKYLILSTRVKTWYNFLVIFLKNLDCIFCLIKTVYFLGFVELPLFEFKHIYLII